MSKPTTIVSIDTDALSYAHPHKEGDEEARKVTAKVRHYLASASSKNIVVALPIVTLTEYLCVYGKEEQDRVIQELDGPFVLAEYDHAAAKELAAMRKDREALKSAQKKTGQVKDCIKYDQMIAAISLAAGATSILTGNTKDYEGLTGGRLKIIDIRGLAMPAIQQPLFDDTTDPK